MLNAGVATELRDRERGPNIISSASVRHFWAGGSQVLSFACKLYIVEDERQQLACPLATEELASTSRASSRPADCCKICGACSEQPPEPPRQAAELIG